MTGVYIILKTWESGSQGVAFSCFLFQSYVLCGGMKTCDFGFVKISVSSVLTPS